MLSLLLLSTLSAASGVPKLACLSFTCGDDIAPVLCEAYESRFTSELSRGGQVAITTQRGVQAALGLERQRQLLGCSDGSCMAEIANALGVDGILTGSVVRAPSGYLFTAKVTRASDGSQWLAASDRVDSENALQDTLDAEARKFRAQLNGQTLTEAPTGSAFRTIAWTGFGLGVAMTAAGGTLLGLSKGQAAILKSDTPQNPLEIAATAQLGSSMQTAGGVLLGVGIPVLLTFLYFGLFQAPGELVVLAPSFSRDTAWVTLQGVLP